jgi:hypothetical protein
MDVGPLVASLGLPKLARYNPRLGELLARAARRYLLFLRPTALSFEAFSVVHSLPLL